MPGQEHSFSLIHKTRRLTGSKMTSKGMLKDLLIICCLMIPLVQGKRKNVLFFVSDDMRPEIEAFSGPDFPSPVHPKMHTPNLDALASRSLLLKRAYVQQAVCSPSRTSLLTGRRPDTTHVYDLVHYFRKVGGNYTTIPQYFKENGYTSVGMGKVFHPGEAASGGDDPISWSEPYYHAPNYAHYTTRDSSWIAVSPEEHEQFPLPDEQIADYAVQTLKRLSNKDKPFFVAVGFHKPHLPFVFPENFLQYYPLENIKVPDNGYAPRNMPKLAWSSYSELRTYHDIAKLHASGAINSSLPSDVIRDLRRAYYSALTYTDSLIGTVMAELKNLGLEEDTIISFWGDHGWQLGEHGEWCKHTNFELATHAPMMVHIPGLTDDGVVTEELTEFVDLFPTLVEAAGLPPLPLCPINSTKVRTCREGTSMLPLITGNGKAAGKWKDRVFSQYPRDGDIMGYSMRTDRYRYTEWVQFLMAPKYQPVWSQMAAVELYDHQTDPEENNNVANDVSYHNTRQTLSKQLHQGWRAVATQNEKESLLSGLDSKGSLKVFNEVVLTEH